MVFNLKNPMNESKVNDFCKLVMRKEKERTSIWYLMIIDLRVQGTCISSTCVQHLEKIAPRVSYFGTNFFQIEFLAPSSYVNLWKYHKQRERAQSSFIHAQGTSPKRFKSFFQET